MSTLITDRVTAHVDYVQRLLKLTSKPATARAVRSVLTHGKDDSASTVGRLALIGSAKSPRVAMITAVSPDKVQVSYLTENCLRHARRLMAHNSHPIQFDSWPDTYREQAVARWKAEESLQWSSDVNTYAARNYEWALKTQALYRAVKHCPWVAFASIHNTMIRRENLVMIPENGEN